MSEDLENEPDEVLGPEADPLGRDVGEDDDMGWMMMAKTINVDRYNVAGYFDGVLLKAHDPEVTHDVPGWRCRACGWQIGCEDLPPSHLCPDDGDEQRTSMPR